MKKIKFLGLALLLLFPINVNADTARIAINCNSTSVKAGDTISCALQGISSDNVTEVVINATFANNLSFAGFTKATENDEGWVGTVDSGYISLYRENAVNGTFDIGTLKVKVSDSATAGSAMITFSNNEFSKGKKIISVEDNSVTITINDNVTPAKKGLKSLRTTGGVLQPQFNPSETGYMLTLDGNNNTFSFEYEPENSGDIVTFVNGDSGETLNPTNITFSDPGGKGNMIIHIQVNDFTYLILVQKNIVNPNGFELLSLKVGDQTVPLISGQHEYQVKLKDVSSYEVVADLIDRENYEITNLISPRTEAGDFTIIISPKDSSSGLTGGRYVITVVEDSSSGSSQVTPPPSTPSSARINNPQTGGFASIVVALVLMASFGISIYFYRKNISYLNK